MLNRRDFLRATGAGLGTLAFSNPMKLLAEQANGKDAPNIVFILADDLGYGDLGCYGAQKIKTPHLDQLAKEGMKFTDFCVASAICSPSRAAFLTGCYPKRVDINYALYSRDRRGLNPLEFTMAEALKMNGYMTACVGKWHLGRQEEFLPPAQGFDRFFGVPYSNDMTPFFHKSSYSHPGYPLYDGKEMVALNPKQEELTWNFAERAAAYIKRSKTWNARRVRKGEAAKPFFLYVPFTAPHEPLFVSERFKGKSAGGLYGDVIEELDWGVGRIMQAVKEQGLEDNTIFIFTSDNGPALQVPGTEHSTGGLRGGKGTTYEGGFRVPCIVKWPKKIKSNTTTNKFWTGMDLLPTLLAAMESEPIVHSSTSMDLETGEIKKHPPKPLESFIDGKSALPIWLGNEGAQPTQSEFLYYARKKPEAIRMGDWKYRLGSANLFDPKLGKKVKEESPVQLFNLKDDPLEKTNLAEKNPDLVTKMKTRLESLDKSISENVRPSMKAPKS